MSTALTFFAGSAFGSFAFALALVVIRDLRAGRRFDGMTRDYRSESEKFARAVSSSMTTPRPKTAPLRVVSSRRA